MNLYEMDSATMYDETTGNDVFLRLVKDMDTGKKYIKVIDYPSNSSAMQMFELQEK